MKEILKAALLRLGVSAAHAALLVANIPDDAEVPKDLTADAVVGGAFAKLSETLETNDAFKDAVAKVRTSTSGKLLKMLTAKARKEFPDVTDEEFEALPEENRYDELVKLAASKKTKAAEGDAATEVSKLNAKLRKKDEELKDLREVQLPAARTAGENERELVRAERAIETALAKGGKLLVKPEFSTDIAAKQLAKKGLVLKIQPDGSTKVMKKDGDGKLIPAHDDHHNEITLDNVAKEIGIEAGLYQLNNGAAGGGKGGDADRKKGDEGADANRGGGGNRMLRGQDKARAHAAELAKRRTEETDRRGGATNDED